MYSLAAIGPGRYAGLATPRCVSATNSASWRLVAFQTLVSFSSS